MTVRLILNADDFGLTAGINRAVGELASAGVLTSATLMANGPAFDDAVAVAHAHPTLGVGCHIVLTDGIPVSPRESISSLLGPDGKTFHPTLSSFLQALFRGRIQQDEVAREALAQVEKLQAAGIAVTHLDTHKHTHLFPAIARPLLEVAERTNVRAIRNPFEPGWSLALHHGSGLRRLGVRLLGSLRSRFAAHPQMRSGSVLTTDGTVAISATGQLDSTSLAEVLDKPSHPRAPLRDTAATPAYSLIAIWTASSRACAPTVTSNAPALPLQGSSESPSRSRRSHVDPLWRSWLDQPTQNTLR